MISLAAVLTSAFAVLGVSAATAQAATETLYNQYTNPELCMLVGQQGVTSGQWLYYYCQEIAPASSAAGQWDLWVEYPG